ncbi:integrin alpha-8 [Esox lucius]|uniref:Integrin alpha-2 domain-containing protein n=1 Tax=Esox lucius TaxID=8010 RepID=A0A3P8XQ75_ESOLU|nr:integrin alpha-8 [Esox lucius]XP_034144966.1 integrin alpha-8 [Esox lucius]
MVFMSAYRIGACLGMLCRVLSVLSVVSGFNLHGERPTVYRGPEGSYFGYSVDFYRPTPESKKLSVLVGAPKANTSQPGIIEGGAVYYCPFTSDPTKTTHRCTQIPFDNTNNRMIKVNGTREPLEFKSHQWFGASVRTHKGKVVACAPLYHWRTVKVNSEKDPVGTCYVAVQNFSAYAEYSPCRTNDPDPEGQGFCQAGFSVDFTKDGTLVVGGPGSFYWQGQVMTAGVADILNGYSLKAVLRRVPGEKHTHAAADTHDDSYLGYSVAVGEFTGDSEQEVIAGVPRGAQNFGYVAMINSTNLTFIMNFTGEQMASYFGYSVAVTDLNGDGFDDVLVGAPLYMERETESKPREVGRVYLYLQHFPLTFSDPLLLTGTHTFGRFGTAIAPLGDLNQDGYNDVAVGCPFGGEDRRGLVLIYNGQKDLLSQGLTVSQELHGAWASSSGLSGYGFTLRGDRDLDNNHYPDLIVGAFGKGEVSVYRARPVVSVETEMILTPRIFNPDDRSCLMTESDTMVTCIRVDVCANVSGVEIPESVVLNTEVQLDWLKGVRGGVKRVHFLDSHQPQRTGVLMFSPSHPHSCLNYTVYLRAEDEFRDKLTPISLAVNYSLAPPPSDLDLPPVLNYFSSTFLQEQAYILLDCGDDNECIPDLQLSASMDRMELEVGDDNLVLLTINAVNKGEGAYETELHTLLPPEADYIGVERRIESLSRLNCEYRMVNDSRLVVCDLGNPMVAGTEVSVGLRFAVQRLDDAGPLINFDLQIHSSNKDNSKSNPISLSLSISARAQLDLRGVSHPSQVVLPFPRWEPKEKPLKEDDVGPQVTHIYELHNSGPSSIREAELQVGWPSRFHDEHLLYAMEVVTDGPISCRTNTSLNPLGLQTSSAQDTPELLGFLRNSSSPRRYRRATGTVQAYSSKTLNCSNIICLRVLCVIGRLDRGQSAVVKIRSRLWAHTFLQRRNNPYLLNSTVSFRVIALPYRLQPSSLPHRTTSMGTLILWGTPDVAFAVPLWVIILAILLGLLVLAVLTLAMWKCGFFDRARPPADDVSDREQLTSDQSADA